jgi:hypothetical protein
MRGLLPLSPSGTMNAVAPEGAPSRQIDDKILKKLPARRASKEALRRGSFVYNSIFMILV